MKYFSLILFSVVLPSFAGGFSNSAVPTRIDVVRDKGFMVFGAFGNGANCSVNDAVFVQINHPQYNQIYSSALAALSAGKKITLYSHICASVGWYNVESVTYNTVTPDGVLVLSNQ